MQIVIYQGISKLSKYIRWFTWSDYSHTGILDTDTGKFYESWEKAGVVEASSFREYHTKGTPVEIYDFKLPLTSSEKEAMRKFLKSQVGKGYDYLGPLRFIPRSNGDNPDAWFCSEYTSEACFRIGRILQHKPSWKMSPADVAESPIIKKIRNDIV